MRIGPDGVMPPEDGVERVQLGYEFWPEALEPTIRHAIEVAGIPVIVTENGIGTEDDTRRIEYIDRALQGVQNCLDDGLDVRGYFCWSSFDNYEWEFGFGPKFGLIAVDRTDQSRHPKPSAHWLGDIARTQTARKTAAAAVTA
jgi:beta-glucosidase